MPRKSVQHVKRKFRLTAKDLTIIISKEWPQATVAYDFGGNNRIGWYIHFNNDKPNIFIGINWIEARDKLNQRTFWGFSL